MGMLMALLILMLNVLYDCGKEWEVHSRINIGAHGSFDVGPNLIAIGGGILAGPWIAITVNITIVAAVLLEAEYHFLSLGRKQAAPIISAALADGPTVICLGTSR